jgi:hypothetical protein
MSTTLKEVAKEVNMPLELVRDILTEKTGIKATREQIDLAFKTARKMNYDFRKLKIGKRMNLRKEILTGIIRQIKSSPKWKRKEILEYLKKSCEMVERVHKKAFEEEFTN